MKFRFLLLLITSIVFVGRLNAQDGLSCATANPFCTDQSYNFPNATSGSASTGSSINFGCLQDAPDPVWYYMEVGADGRIDMTLSQSTGPNGSGSGLDVDYTMWGPFSSLSSGCASVLGGNVPIQSSYSGSSTETASIGGPGGSNSICASGHSGQGATTPPPAVAGQVYIFFITNYSQQPGYITFAQTNSGSPGAGSADCAIVEPQPCVINAVTASATCTGANSTISGTVDFNDAPSSGTLVVSSSCGGSQTFNAPFGTAGSGVLNYSFNGGASDGSTCTITAQFSDDSGCTGTATVVKSSSASISITYTPPTCTNPGKVVVNGYDPTLTYSFSPSGPALTTDGTVVGATYGTNYTISVVSPCGNADTTFTIQDVLPPPSLPAVSVQTPTCSADGIATITNYDASYTYTFSPTGPTISAGGVVSGMTVGTNYTVQAAAGTCVSSTTPLSIDAQLTPPAITVGTISTATCNINVGGAQISVSGGTAPYQYAWSDGSTNQNLTNVAGGTYSVTVTDNSGCTATQGNIVVPTTVNPTLTIGNIATAGCSLPTGGIEINVSGGTPPYIYSWSDGSTNQNLTNVLAGTYTVLVTDASGCTANNGSGTTVPAETGFQLSGTTTDVTCSNPGAITLTVGAGVAPYSYAWSNGDTVQNLTNITSGVYSVTVTDLAGCTETATFDVGENVGFIIDIDTINPDCGQTNGSISATVINGQGTYQYTYTPNNVSDSVITNLGPGTYNLQIVDQYGCVVNRTIILHSVGHLPTTVTASDSIVQEGNSTNLSVTLNPYIPGVLYSWSPTESLSCTDCPTPIATPTQATCYVVSVKSPDGCVSKDSVCIDFRMNCGDIFIPSVFSPNHDANNDYFRAYGRCLAKVELTIFDRWGNKVFYSDKLDHGWDGTIHGMPANTGVYMYMINVTELYGEMQSFHGSVTLVR